VKRRHVIKKLAQSIKNFLPAFERTYTPAMHPRKFTSPTSPVMLVAGIPVSAKRMLEK